MTDAARTVLGDVAPDRLGLCDAHDHLFFRSAQFAGQELDDVAAADAELRDFRDAGGRTLVQWTPYGLNRRRADLAELARTNGVNLIAATGLHQRRHYPPDLVDDVWDGLAELFVNDLTTAPVRAGLIKVAGEFHGVDAHARHVMAAAAAAHHATGAPIAVHLESGTGADAVVDRLCGDLDVPPDNVILGHLSRLPDIRAHLQTARSGTYLAFDGPSRANHATDWRLFDTLAALTEAGYHDRMLLGGDTTTAAARASSGGGPGIGYLLRTIRTRLIRELGQDLADEVFIGNPARAFAVAWRR